MPYKLYNFLNDKDENEFKLWSSSLQTRERAKLNSKLDKLEMHGDDLYPEMLSGTSAPGIQKIRAKGNVQLRPLLCKGPLIDDTTKEIEQAYTLLMGAIEVGGKWKPKKAPEMAEGKKQEVLSSSGKRRVKHERVS